jgi:hypothetical protein
VQPRRQGIKRLSRILLPRAEMHTFTTFGTCKSPETHNRQMNRMLRPGASLAMSSLLNLLLHIAALLLRRVVDHADTCPLAEEVQTVASHA